MHVAKTKGLIRFTVNYEADLRLCFRISKNPVFSCSGSLYSDCSKCIVLNILDCYIATVFWFLCRFVD